jgi:hypothetical protein
MCSTHSCRTVSCMSASPYTCSAASVSVNAHVHTPLIESAHAAHSALTYRAKHAVAVASHFDQLKAARVQLLLKALGILLLHALRTRTCTITRAESIATNDKINYTVCHAVRITQLVSFQATAACHLQHSPHSRTRRRCCSLTTECVSKQATIFLHIHTPVSLFELCALLPPLLSVGSGDRRF